MSHNLAINPRTSDASFFTVREQAWHKLGTVLDDCPTSADAIQYAGLDYRVEKAALQAYTLPLTPGTDAPLSENDNWPYAPIADRYATVRTDTMQALGVVGRQYEVVQNTQAFAFFDAIVGKNEAFYETAGALGKGEVTFISAKLPSTIKVLVNGSADEVDKYLLLTNSHDGSSAVRILFTPVRVVCNNTLNMALRSRDGIALRHTGSVHAGLKEAAKVLGIVKREYEAAGDTYQQLANIKINDRLLRRYIDEVFPAQQAETIGGAEEVSTRLLNIRNKAFEYTMQGAGQGDIEGTAWWAYNGITGYFQNVRTFGTYEQLLKTNVMGSGQNVMQKALRSALALA